MNETRKINDLHEWEQNPRNITPKDFERLKGQVKKLGQYKPLIVTKDNEVIGGNMRLRAYRELGITDIWVSIVDPKDETQKMEFALSDNDRAGYYDDDALANLIPNYQIDWSQYAVDMKPPEDIQALIDRIAPTTEDEAPPLTTSPAVSKYGELYQLGRHWLMCGDATKLADIQKLMGGQTADMVFTDPPYNINYEGTPGGAKREGILNDNMSEEQFYQFLLASFQNMMAVCNGSYYVCMSSKELPQLKTAFEVAGGHWQSFIIWIKNHFTLSRNDYQNQYEPILYGWNKNITNHYFIDDRTQGNVWLELGNKATYDGKYTEMTIGGLKVRLEGKVNGQILKGKRKIDIWRYDKPTKNPDHPTMKPVSMVIEALINSSHKGQSVLDPFGGSGTTLIAAEQTNRVCYMSELDPKYCDVIRKRYAKFIGQEDEWQTITKAL